MEIDIIICLLEKIFIVDVKYYKSIFLWWMGIEKFYL